MTHTVCHHCGYADCVCIDTTPCETFLERLNRAERENKELRAALRDVWQTFAAEGDNDVLWAGGSACLERVQEVLLGE